MYFTYRNLKAKIDEIAYIYFYQGLTGSNYNVKSPYTVEIKGKLLRRFHSLITSKLLYMLSNFYVEN